MSTLSPPPPRSFRAGLLWLAIGAGVASLLTLTAGPRDALLGMLAWAGGAQLAPASVSGLDRESGVAEYLVVLSGAPPPAAYLAYFEAHPGIEYRGRSLYPRTERVGLTLPVGATIDDLEGQPFVAFVIKSHPFYFCH